MGTINDRMEQIVNEQFNGNKSAFATKIGIPRTMISSYLGNKKRSKPGLEIIIKIVTNLNVDPYWLLTGEKKEKEKEQEPTSINGTGIQVKSNNSQIHVATAIR